MITEFKQLCKKFICLFFGGDLEIFPFEIRDLEKAYCSAVHPKNIFKLAKIGNQDQQSTISQLTNKLS